MIEYSLNQCEALRLSWEMTGRSMTENKIYWCNAFDGLAWQTYVESRPKSIRLLNAINSDEMTVNPEYARSVSVV